MRRPFAAVLGILLFSAALPAYAQSSNAEKYLELRQAQLNEQQAAAKEKQTDDLFKAGLASRSSSEREARPALNRSSVCFCLAWACCSLSWAWRSSRYFSALDDWAYAGSAAEKRRMPRTAANGLRIGQELTDFGHGAGGERRGRFLENKTAIPDHADAVRG